jgi:cytosine/adenosine deaminase-related metal-dependent hydrolase
LTIGAAILGPHYSTLDVAFHDFRMARHLGLIASMHQGGGPARTPGGWARLEEEGLLGPHVNIVHGHGLDDIALARFAGLGMSFSIAPESEMTQGHGHPITGKLRALGRAPSLGVDLESLAGGSILAQARMALALQRSLDNVAARDATGAIPATTTIPVRDALAWATIEGARMLGQEHRIGSLVPGKQADLVLIRVDTLDLMPVHDPVATVVLQAGRSNVERVMVAGRWRKVDGHIDADTGSVGRALERSGRRVAAALGLGHQRAACSRPRSTRCRIVPVAVHGIS